MTLLRLAESVVRMTASLPVIDIDGSLWSVYADKKDPDGGVMIQICEGYDCNSRDGSPQAHPFDGEWHEGDTHLFLDNDAAYRLLAQLREALEPH